MNKGLRRGISKEGTPRVPGENSDLMNKGLRPARRFRKYGSSLCGENSDLMNKGLRPLTLSEKYLSGKYPSARENSDLMNKGLRQLCFCLSG